MNRKQIQLVFWLTLLTACNRADQKNGGDKSPATPPSREEQVSRGRYLVTIIGCGDCHTPMIMTPAGPVRDTMHLLGGHPTGMPLPPFDKALTKTWMLVGPASTSFAGPWGVSFASNISSDATGIGNWTEEHFFKALRHGKAKGLDNGRMLLPPMPWQTYEQLTDEDTRAIFEYLKSTRPVKNLVPPPVQ